MQKRVKMLRNGIQKKKTSSHIILVPLNAIGLSGTIFFLVTNNAEWGERNFRLCPLLGPQGI